MSIHTCGDYPTDPNCTCFSQTKENIHHYSQFNNDKQNYTCCDTIYVNPSQVVKTVGGCCYSLNSAIGYLKYINDNEITDCDYSKYFGDNTDDSQIVTHMRENFHELYENAEVNYNIYKNFYCIPGSGTGTSPPIPVFSDHRVSCPPTYVPYLISYKTELDNSPFGQYSYICYESQAFPQINIGNVPLDYTVNYLYTTNDIPCIQSSCATNYESGNYNNLANQEPFFQGKKPKNDETLLGVGITLLILSLIIFGVLGYYIYKEDEKKKVEG